MRRLIWKELREKRLWALLLFASAAGVIVLGDGYTFCGEEIAGWATISTVAAFLLGGSAYSSELAGGRADFLYSRGISWKKVLLAKLLVGLGAVVLTVLASAVVYRLFCPAPLLPFATPAGLVKGAAIAMLTMGIAYAIGFLCSIVLPGVFGSMLVTFVIAAALGVTISVLMEVYKDAKDFQGVALLAGWVLGAVVATVVTARFGLTLTTAARAVRYALIVGLIGIVVGSVAFVTIGMADLSSNPAVGSESQSISPDGRYAIVQYVIYERRDAPGREIQLVKRADGSRLTIAGRLSLNGHGEYAETQQYYWVDNTNAVMITRGTPNRAFFVHISDTQKPLSAAQVRVEVVTVGNLALLVPSPNRKLAILVPSISEKSNPWAVTMRNLWEHTGGNSRHRKLVVFDALKGREIGAPIRDAKAFWWQSNTEIGYADKAGKRHIVRVVE